MKEPYADDATTRGIRLTPYSELEELVQAADAADLQVCCHPDLSFVHTDMHPLNMQEVANCECCLHAQQIYWLYG